MTVPNYPQHTPAYWDLIRNRLERLDALLATKDQWTTVVGARTATGKVISPNDPQAVCWCLYGGAYKVSRLLDEITPLIAALPDAQQVMDRVSPKKLSDEIYNTMLMCFRHRINEMGGAGLTLGEYNDDNDFETIKSLIQKAISAIAPRSDAGAGSVAAA